MQTLFIVLILLAALSGAFWLGMHYGIAHAMRFVARPTKSPRW